MKKEGFNIKNFEGLAPFLFNIILFVFLFQAKSFCIILKIDKVFFPQLPASNFVISRFSFQLTPNTGVSLKSQIHSNLI